MKGDGGGIFSATYLHPVVIDKVTETTSSLFSVQRCVRLYSFRVKEVFMVKVRFVDAETTFVDSETAFVVEEHEHSSAES